MPPAALAHQQLSDGHRLDLPRVGANDLRSAQLPDRDPALHLSAREAHQVGALERLHVLRAASVVQRSPILACGGYAFWKL
jgi:hypothetical protein